MVDRGRRKKKKKKTEGREGEGGCFKRGWGGIAKKGNQKDFCFFPFGERPGRRFGEFFCHHGEGEKKGTGGGVGKK